MNEETFDLNKNNKPEMMSLVLKWGLIISFALVAISVIVYIAGMSTNKAIGWVNYILMFVGVIFATKVFRDEKCGGYISFGTAFKFGFFTLFLVGVITAIYTYVFFSFIAPELTGKILTQVENDMLNSGQSEEQIEMAMSYTRKFMTPGWMVAWVLVGSVFMGAIFSLISAAVVKKENQDLQPPV